MYLNSLFVLGIRIRHGFGVIGSVDNQGFNSGSQCSYKYKILDSKRTSILEKFKLTY